MTRFDRAAVERTHATLQYLRADALAYAERHADDAERVVPPHGPSAQNLLHYLALRQHDLRELQAELTAHGLSSLGRSEAAVLASLDAVLANLRVQLEVDLDPASAAPPPVDHDQGAAILERRTHALLGPLPPGRERRIMVTVPGAAAADPGLIHELVEAGMDVMRINTAHDGPEAWVAMASHLRTAREKTGRHCLIQFDLAGPKLRTGALEGGDRVVHWRPGRNERGAAVRPARILVVPAAEGLEASAQGAGAAAVLPVSPELLKEARIGDRLRLRDLRGRKPELELVALVGDDPASGFLAEGWRGCYVETGARVDLRRHRERLATGRVGLLPRVVVPLAVRRDDRLVITRSQEPGRAGRRDEHGAMVEPARIPCSLAEALADVKPGERLWIDDGKIGCVVEEASADALQVRVTHAAPGGCRLRPDKGINLPDSTLGLPSLTAQDLEHLDFAVQHADLIGMSFVRTRACVEQLMDELRKRDAGGLGIVLKVETSQAFANLPDLLLTGMRWPKLGIMVARGDLAVEIGFGRIAEVQEEVLWLCEAAHVPVVWATQVLDTLARRGQATRPEVTDAAMSGRAECIMLNKGPHVVEAVRFLDDVARRMKTHQEKKRSLLRALSVSHVHRQHPHGDGTP